MSGTSRTSLILLALLIASLGLATGCGSESGSTGPALDTVPPAIPLDISGNAVTNSGISLNWAANTVDPDLAGYVVYRSQSANRSYVPLSHGPVATNSYVDTSAQPGNTYWYTIAARDLNRNESGQSAPVQITMPALNSPQPKSP